jgi:hypothetical protein
MRYPKERGVKAERPARLGLKFRGTNPTPSTRTPGSEAPGVPCVQKMLIHPPCSRRASSTRCIQVRDTLRTVIVHTVVRSITLDSGMVIPSNGERSLPRSSGSGELAARSVGGG